MVVLVVRVVLLALRALLVLAVPLVLAPQVVQLGHGYLVGPVHPEDQVVHLFQANQHYLVLL